MTVTLKNPPQKIIHEELLKLIREYVALGGMPAAYLHIFKQASGESRTSPATPIRAAGTTCGGTRLPDRGLSARLPVPRPALRIWRFVVGHQLDTRYNRAYDAGRDSRSPRDQT